MNTEVDKLSVMYGGIRKEMLQISSGDFYFKIMLRLCVSFKNK